MRSRRLGRETREGEAAWPAEGATSAAGEPARAWSIVWAHSRAPSTIGPPMTMKAGRTQSHTRLVENGQTDTDSDDDS